MAFVGNDMFGHGMTHHPSGLMHNGGGFGSGGFGSSSHQSAFGSGMSHGSGFGQGFGGSHGSPPGTNPNQPIFHRQNSLLTDMTHSKTDPKPVYISEFNQSAVRHEDQIYSNMYEKPLEKPKLQHATSTQERRKTFQRQKAVSDDDIARTPRLSSRTRSTSLSMYPVDDPDARRQPMNMDVAQSLLRRSNTVSGKPNKSKHKFLRPLSIGHRFRKRTDSRSSTSSTEPPRSEPPRSIKYDSDIEIFVEAPRPRSSSDAPLKSNTSKSDDEQAHLILSLMNPPSSPESEMNHKSAYQDVNQNMPPNANYQSPQKPENHRNEETESPSTVRRRFHDRSLDHDSVSLTSGRSVASGRSTPKSVHVITTQSLVRTLTIETPARRQTNSPRRSPDPSPRGSPNHSPRRSPNNIPESVTNYKPCVINNRIPVHQNNRSDSENTDVNHEGDNAEKGRKSRRENMDRKKGKSREQPEKPQDYLLYTGYNSDDEASNPDSPRTDPFHNYENLHNANPTENKHDDSTLCVRKLIDSFNQKPEENTTEDHSVSPTLKHIKPEVRDIVAAVSFAKHFGSNEEDQHDNVSHTDHSPDDTYHERPPEIIIPKFESIVKGQEPNEAESSESGYTSNLQNSPRDFELKAAQYVNSLPHHAETVNRKTVRNEMVRSGSQTESDNESDLSEAPCKSGSDTDYHMSETETLDESDTKLEVMKILESPSEVVQRIHAQMPRKEKMNINEVPIENTPLKAKKASVQTAPIPINPQIVHSPNSAFIEKRSSLKNKNKQGSEESETEIKHLHIQEPRPTKLVLEAQPQNNLQNQKAETILVHTSKPGSPKANAETRMLPKKSTPSLAATIMDMPLLGFRKPRLSSIEQSKCVNYLDTFLHCLNVLLFVSSGGVVGVGIWLILKEFNVNHIAEIFGNNIIQVIMYVAVGGAALALLAAMCLCCGVRRDKFGLGFYASVLVIVVLALGTATVLCVIFLDKLEGVEFKVQFKDRLITKYGNSEDSVENKLFTEAWDRMQKAFECCGAHGDINDTTSWAVYKKFSAWYKIQPNKVNHFVPESCCTPDGNVDVCRGSDHYLFGPPVYGPPMDRGFSAKNPNLNTDGCYKMVTAYLRQLLTITALVTGGLGGLYFIVVMLTWVLCFKRQTDTDYSYDYDYDDDDEVFDEEEDEEVDEATDESKVNKENSNGFVKRDEVDNNDVLPDKKVHENPVKRESCFDKYVNINTHEHSNDHFSDISNKDGNIKLQNPNNAGTIPFYSDMPVISVNTVEPVCFKMTERISPSENVISRIQPDKTSPHVIESISPEVIERFSPGSEAAAMDRRDRYETSDSRLDMFFTDTIEEEDSNYEDSDAEIPHDHKLTQSQLKGYFKIKDAQDQF